MIHIPASSQQMSTSILKGAFWHSKSTFTGSFDRMLPPRSQPLQGNSSLCIALWWAFCILGCTSLGLSRFQKTWFSVRLHNGIYYYYTFAYSSWEQKNQLFYSVGNILFPCRGHRSNPWLAYLNMDSVSMALEEPSRYLSRWVVVCKFKIGLILLAMYVMGWYITRRCG